ncbi:unnamed protein product (macronuclear) [Paramecium tetraurelia]|uniref:Transmembrane protein n=1 Tax=Paramecium tetraurelia TaxID=5888 RepID=A0DWI4_PARTE|nr:uncharacterized protein GSPATT00021043001 [Paramecium tetraurelia]CAK87401.1 unnamed protein product [Paramecium tetraurelia]|eukprot:XP_001454798.1 hypothetical protein (macronuclear) [Paramecium tetraurelia strain d4-2]
MPYFLLILVFFHFNDNLKYRYQQTILFLPLNIFHILSIIDLIQMVSVYQKSKQYMQNNYIYSIQYASIIVIVINNTRSLIMYCDTLQQLIFVMQYIINLVNC